MVATRPCVLGIHLEEGGEEGDHGRELGACGVGAGFDLPHQGRLDHVPPDHLGEAGNEIGDPVARLPPVDPGDRRVKHVLGEKGQRAELGREGARGWAGQESRRDVHKVDHRLEHGGHHPDVDRVVGGRTPCSGEKGPELGFGQRRGEREEGPSGSGEGG